MNAKSLGQRWLSRIPTTTFLSADSSTRQWVSLLFPAQCLACEQPLSQSGFDSLSKEVDRDAGSIRPESEIPPGHAVQFACNSTLEFQAWQQAHWCDGCWRKLQPRCHSRCRRCGAVLFRLNPLNQQCAHCYGHALRFDRAFAVGNYQGLLQRLTVEMKNQRDEPLAIQLGTLLGFELLANGWTEFDQIVPVPSHWIRKFKRGFQAADVIADTLSQRLGVPKSVRTVRTTRTTKKQGTLSTTARIANVRDAFELYPKADVRGQRILLVDDVLTSGATTSELARVLKRRGAAEVSVAVVARGAGVS